MDTLHGTASKFEEKGGGKRAEWEQGNRRRGKGSREAEDGQWKGRSSKWKRRSKGKGRKAKGIGEVKEGEMNRGNKDEARFKISHSKAHEPHLTNTER